MENKCYKTVTLDNNYTLDIVDESKKIAEDAYVVRMTAKMDIPVEKGLFTTQAVSDDQFDEILKTLGTPILYEYKMERNMIMAKDKEETFENLVDTFFENMGQYIARPQFPEKLVLKEYRQRIERKGK